MGDHVETRGKTAPKTSKSVHYNYNANFQLMVIKHADKTNNCTGTEIPCCRTEHILLPKTKGIIINDRNST